MSYVPKILWLKGVSKKDLVTMDHLFNSMSIESTSQNNLTQDSLLDVLYSSSNDLSDTNNEIEYIKYDKIPKVFKNPRPRNISGGMISHSMP